jgi:hypothetical protein
MQRTVWARGNRPPPPAPQPPAGVINVLKFWIKIAHFAPWPAEQGNGPPTLRGRLWELGAESLYFSRKSPSEGSGRVLLRSTAQVDRSGTPLNRSSNAQASPTLLSSAHLTHSPHSRTPQTMCHVSDTRQLELVARTCSRVHQGLVRLGSAAMRSDSRSVSADLQGQLLASSMSPPPRRVPGSSSTAAQRRHLWVVLQPPCMPSRVKRPDQRHVQLVWVLRTRRTSDLALLGARTGRSLSFLPETREEQRGSV